MDQLLGDMARHYMRRFGGINEGPTSDGTIKNSHRDTITSTMAKRGSVAPRSALGDFLLRRWTAHREEVDASGESGGGQGDAATASLMAALRL